MTRRILLAAALLPLLGACDRQALTPEAGRTAPTSAIHPATGEPVALNAPAVQALPAGSDAGMAAEACDTIIETFITQETGVEPEMHPEADGLGTSECGYMVLIGVGMRMSSNSDITTLHLKYQRVNADGTLGRTELRAYGMDPNHALEAYAEALPGEAIVGIGVGSQNTTNINTLRIWKRPIGLVSGAVRTYGSITAESFGVTPGGVLDTSAVIPLSVTDHVYVGFGARANSAKVKTARHHWGILR